MEIFVNTDIQTQLRELLKRSQSSLKTCDLSYKALRAFRGNNQGMAFCLEQLHQGAAALRDYADALVALAVDPDTTQSALTQPEETLDNDSSLEEQRRRNGVTA
jgi:hypothetical protein